MFYQYVDLPVTEYVDYFIKDYIPSNNIIDSILNSNLSYIKSNNIPDILKDLERSIREKYKILLIVEYFSIFYHISNQPIHIDGDKNFRYSSLNLPLVGFENTKMCFYKSKTNSYKKSDAYYFNPEDVELVDQVEGTPNWILVNSGVPHNIINIDSNNPRLTLCLRFVYNPKFENIKKYFWLPQQESNL